MKRIDTATRAQNLFGAGKDGFRNGDLANGITPTDFNADWPNHIQEEIANVVEAAGIALNAGVKNQLLLALRAGGVFSTPLSTDNSTKVATTAWAKLGMASSFTANGYLKFPAWMGGLLLQWGNMTNLASATNVTSFLIPFPVACLAVVPAGLQGGGNQQAYVTMNEISAVNFNWTGFYAPGGSAPALSASAGQVQGRFIAIGI